MARKSRLTAEQKSEAIMAMIRKEEPVIQISRRYGVSEQSLYRWYEEFLAGGRSALSGSADNQWAASGIYLVRINDGNGTIIKKVALIR